jgi:hypothetical protein
MAVSVPIVVVMNATSKQGTSVVNSVLQTGLFKVKATTRDASSKSAPALDAIMCHRCHPLIDRVLMYLA